MRKNIPYGKQNITDEDIQAVIEALKSDHITQGPKIKEFEDNFANYVGANYAIAVANGTAALHLCTLALEVSPGDKVITTPITFAASANCVRYSGGEVIFGDIDLNSYLLDLESVKKLLDSSKKGTYKGLILVDFAGRPINLEEYGKIAAEYDLWIIEDACHSPGGYFVDKNGNKQFCGNGNFADLAVFSFHPVKHITSGEGGMITTNRYDLYQKILRLRTHGMVKEVKSYTNSIELAGGKDDYPLWYMEMQTLGYNYRITDIQAALGNSQLQRADHGLMRRKEIALKYEKSFKGKGYILGQSGYVEGHAYHLYVIEVRNRLELYNFLRDKGVFAQIHYIPCHLMPYYRSFGWKQGDRPNSELYYRQCISLPMYPALSDFEQQFVIDTIDEYYRK